MAKLDLQSAEIHYDPYQEADGGKILLGTLCSTPLSVSEESKCLSDHARKKLDTLIN